MLIYIICGIILLATVYSIGFLRGAYKATDSIMKAYIKFKKRQGASMDDISKEVIEMKKILKAL